MALRLTVRVLSNKFGKIAKQLQPAADAITDEVLAEGLAYARSIAPVDTGEHRDSLGTEREGPGAGVLYAGAPHSIFLEWGTVHQAAQPTLIPASEFMRPLMLARMRDLESRLG